MKVQLRRNMTVPQRKFNSPEDEPPVLVRIEPGLSSGNSYPRDDYDPQKLVALLRHFRDDPTEEPEQQWAEFLKLARAIDEDRPPGLRLFDKYLCE
jgi:hypothetical protein